MIVWVVWSLPYLPVPISAATTPLKDVAPSNPPPGGLDRAALQQELSRSTAELEAQPSEGLRSYIQRLAELHASLELASDLPPSERRALGEQILARVAHLGLMLRQRAAPTVPPGKSRGFTATGSVLAPVTDMAGALWENPGLFVGLLGGLVIAFALGNLAGYRRGAREASYYGEGDPRIRFLARPPANPWRPGEQISISLAHIRRMLAAGRTVMLQMGYEIAPSHRRRYLDLIGEMQGILSHVDGQSYTVWEDPKHPHRFYELLVCYRLAALDQLAATDGPLPKLGEGLEACRLPGGPVLRRAWWGVIPEPERTERPAPVLEASLVN